MRCGLIFDRYRLDLPARESDVGRARPGFSHVRRTLRIFRRLSLACTVLALLLILWQPSPPPVETSPEAGARAETKVREFQAAAAQGHQAALRMDEAELNSWVQSNMSGGAEAAPTQASAGAEGPEQSASEQAQSNVRDLRLQLEEDRLRAYVLIDFHGKELSLMLEGRLEVRDGCLRLMPETGKLGSLPLPRSTLESAAQRLFDSSENREKFRLPPAIRDVRVENSGLVVSSR